MLWARNFISSMTSFKHHSILKYLIFLIVWLSWGCQTNHDAESVASNFFHLLESGEIENTMKLTTPESASILKLMVLYSSTTEKTESDSLSHQFQIENVFVMDTIARVKYLIKNKEGHFILDLRKRNDRWLVHLNRNIF
jgi:hypothetical protein